MIDLSKFPNQSKVTLSIPEFQEIKSDFNILEEFTALNGYGMAAVAK